MSWLGDLAIDGWVRYWRTFQRYHRYTVQGMEHLRGDRSMLIAGYHGRPLAIDMCMLTVAIHDRLGYLPHGIVHRNLESFPTLKQLTDALGFVTRDGPEIDEAIDRGEHIVTTPGGGQEGCRSFLQRYEVAWQGRLGFVRMAAKYRLPIVPVGAEGADDTYFGFYDAEAFARRIGVSRQQAYSLWLGVGPLGFYPFSPPFPVRIRQTIGTPIDPWNDLDPDDPASYPIVHEQVVGAVQAILDQARTKSPDPLEAWR